MPSQDRPSWMEQPNDRATWSIAVGVAVGVIAAGVVLFVAQRWYAQYEMRQALAAIQAQTKATAEAIERRQVIERERREAAAERRRQDLADQQRATAAAAFAQQREQQRREDAWANFYRRPERCVQPADTAVFTECANEHVRARRRFEELWAAGKL